MNPRYGEKLYGVPNTPGQEGGIDFHFGMQLEANFAQPPSGKDDWGHDIVFEFSGDDDFWLYVDGQTSVVHMIQMCSSATGWTNGISWNKWTTLVGDVGSEV